ncbi:MAG TPA: molybdopterin cofactor-binding domain-containing protein [Verrucomicrobiales bacterium]|nr:molybdopterin cofactor-binding domain-containing protein [Verrucomicrobiales bacterium]
MRIHSEEDIAESLRCLGIDADGEEIVERVPYRFKLDVDRRDFVKLLGAGLLIGVAASSEAQEPGRGRGRGGGRGGNRGPSTLSARLHIGKDGIITVMTGKVECGQGARAELTQAAAEELRVTPASVRMVMADTSLVPDDGGTSGSRTTPGTVPSIRQGCAAAREVLAGMAAKRWSVDAKTVQVRDGKAGDGKPEHSLTYADLAADEEAGKAMTGEMPRGVTLTPVVEWKVLGAGLPRPNASDIVTGRHHYPSDMTRPGMLHGRILRRPSYGAKLISLDASAAKAMPGVVVVQDGDFAGVAAPTSWLAQKAIEALAAGAKWESRPHPASAALSDHLRSHAQGGIPVNPFAAEMAAGKALRRTYEIAYVQHAPMEPRAALAEWEGGQLTVWTASQQPFGVRGEVARAFNLAEDKVRVIIPDFGGGFGGKHSGESAVEAARLAKSAGKPVQLRWTREEEFTWAQFRPAALIEAEASLDGAGKISSWYFINVNSGGSSLRTPYRTEKNYDKFVSSDAPLRHGSYRALASTANTFARESLMDELAAEAGKDPLEFRLAHLEPGRLRSVLEAAAKKFDWSRRAKEKTPGRGVGLACGTDKGSFVAACAEVTVKEGVIAVKYVCQAYDCGKVMNPDNLQRQVKGGIIMGLGPALREEMKFENGKILNATFKEYKVPRFDDVPKFDIVILDAPDVESAGAGETPVIAIAPAIANAVFHATGKRLRRMPLRMEEAK